ncbi:uncharacterized protein [Dermacentor albipictus]|uniref:uncharacterized protein n=1 Tax=Dermacentor albipictus TaxID=60249 RepID=UPI0038FC0E3B
MLASMNSHLLCTRPPAVSPKAPYYDHPVHVARPSLYTHACPTSEGHYNREHASMRSVVERCIGVLKSKFRCLQHFRTLLYSPDRAARIIYACVALHNIALDAGDWTLDDYGGEVPPAEEPEEPGDIQVLAPHDVFLRGSFSEGHRNGAQRCLALWHASAPGSPPEPLPSSLPRQRGGR